VAPVFPKPLPYRYTVRDALPWIIAQGDNGGFGKGQMRPADQPSPTIGAELGSGNGNFPPSKVVARVIHDTSGEFGQGDITDHPSPAITVGVNAVNSHHFQVRVIHDNRRPNEPARDITDTPAATVAASFPGFFHVTSADMMTDPETGKNLTIKPPRQIGREGRADTQPCTDNLYQQCRKLTLGELRRLGGFPDDFALTGTYEQRWERIGRAVPPVMMSHIAATIRDQILEPLREQGKI